MIIILFYDLIGNIISDSQEGISSENYNMTILLYVYYI